MATTPLPPDFVPPTDEEKAARRTQALANLRHARAVKTARRKEREAVTALAAVPAVPAMPTVEGAVQVDYLQEVVQRRMLTLLMDPDVQVALKRVLTGKDQRAAIEMAKTIMQTYGGQDEGKKLPMRLTVMAFPGKRA